jgi:ketosteroid isomerase-like protein
MSQENVENLRRGFDAWNRGDRDGFLAGFAPEAELHATARVDQGIFRGREGLERYWAETRETLDELRTSVSEIRAVGEDKVLASTTASGRGKESKAPWELPMWFVATFRDGLCVRIEFYLDLEQALEAAGLQE